jgi:hypothetical protein
MEKHLYFGKMIATVHLTEGSDGILAHWFVSGPGDLWMIRLLLELKLKSPSSSMKEALEMAEEVGRVYVPTADLDAAMKSVPTTLDTTCPICLVTPCDRATIPCNHLFCQTCLREWLQSHHTCPICIHDFNS